MHTFPKQKRAARTRSFLKRVRMLASSLSTRKCSCSLFWQFRTSLMNTESPRMLESAMADPNHNTTVSSSTYRPNCHKNKVTNNRFSSSLPAVSCPAYRSPIPIPRQQYVVTLGCQKWQDADQTLDGGAADHSQMLRSEALQVPLFALSLSLSLSQSIHILRINFSH